VPAARTGATLELRTALQTSVLDMHLHSAVASSDSTLKPGKLMELGPEAGLTGANITEHDKMWDPYERETFLEQHAAAPFFINFGMEVSTDLGHMTAIGLHAYVGGIRRAEQLRSTLDAVGGFLVVNHPFRHVFDDVTAMRTDGKPFDLTPEQAAELPVFQLVDAIEIANGCNTPRENYFAHEVARILGKPTTGGSDAHSDSGIGYYATGFEREVTSADALLTELHAGRFEAVLRGPSENPGHHFVRFEPGCVEAVAAAGA
jgi:predicted metal-dependent phosphoesterase TrpH